MAPSGRRRVATQPTPMDDESVWDPYTLPDPQDEEVWDPNIDWEVDRAVGMEISSDGTKQYALSFSFGRHRLSMLPHCSYEVRWGGQWHREDGSNTTWVSSKDKRNDVMETNLPDKLERTLEAAAKKKAKASDSVEVETIMTAWPHDWDTAARAEAWDEKLERHQRQHAEEFDEKDHLILDWTTDIIDLHDTSPSPAPHSALQRLSYIRSESRTLSDAGTPATRMSSPRSSRVPLPRLARRRSVSLHSESNASTLRPESTGRRHVRSLSPDDMEMDDAPASPASEGLELSLKTLETRWSNAAQTAHAEGLALVNDVDDELPGIPHDFQWVENAYLFLPGREPVPTYAIHCRTCNECEAGDSCNCIEAVEDVELAEGAYADKYTLREPLLDRESGFVVRECNIACGCGEKCLNKVSQAPRNWTLDIFKTDDKRGWGVRTRDKLDRGKILGIYTGVLRPPAQDDDDEVDGSIGNDYSFALDGGHVESDADHAWSVNSYRAGNWTRFVNHSCDPNMRTYSRVMGEYTKPASDGQELYYIVFVAKQDIPPHTELTLDYRPGTRGGRGTGRQRCLCGARNCRKRLYTV
ncbi:unnamed protein product [Peniophora sp. CBMAI 1063]|nr:unnamed protein product [Peniophora sp. CBMAI 1063]